MIWIILLFFALFFGRASYNVRGFHERYLAPDAMLAVKGLFILLVFASHFMGYVKESGTADIAYRQMRWWLGQMVVVPFLFFSGYGVVEQIRRKGQDYLRAFPLRRILKTAFLFWLAVLLFWAVRSAMGFHYDANYIFLSFLGWKSIGNSNWYIFVVVILYALTWLAFAMFPRREVERAALPAVAVFTLACVVLTEILMQCRPNYVYNTIFAYCAGCWFSLYKEKWNSLVSANRTWLGFVALAILGYVSCHRQWKAIFAYDLASVIFALFIVLVSMSTLAAASFRSWANTYSASTSSSEYR